MPLTSNVIRGGLAFQEIGYDPVGTPGWDVDGLGVSGANDEFLSIVNVSGLTINLTGVEIWEDGLLHSFSSGSIAPGEVIYIVDEGENVSLIQPNAPAGAQIFAANGTMGMANADSLALVDTSTGGYVKLEWGGEGPAFDVTASPGFPGTTLGGLDTVALSADGQTFQRDPVGFDTFVVANATLCFAEGTWIATPGGEARVEALRIGDTVRTADGRAVPVRWVGRQTIAKRFAGERARLVRIGAGALGNHSDLLVTADHGMVFPSSSEALGGIKDGYVVNASALVNGADIDWVPRAETPEVQTVYHVETAAHDVILANGAASESYLDIPGRQAFDNYQEYLDLYGAEQPIAEAPMPRITSGRLLPAQLRARLVA